MLLACSCLAGCGAGVPNSVPTATPAPTIAARPSEPALPTVTAAAEPTPAANLAKPAATAAATPAPGLLPAELVIPSIRVDAPVEHVGTTADGAMDVPKQWNDVAWFDQGYKPGQPGSAVIAGHLDSTTDKAVFWDLNKLKPGDKVLVKSQDGVQLTFQVVSDEVYPFDRAPLQRIFGPSSQPMLNLVTCNGIFDRGTKNYDKRLVVYTRLAQ
jgi:LPXTG-site transpeptidase (sortase) family protein